VWYNLCTDSKKNLKKEKEKEKEKEQNMYEVSGDETTHRAVPNIRP